MSHPRYSIIIPAYNESARIERTLNQVLSCIEQQGWDAVLTVVDDGSTDDTAQIVERCMTQAAGRLHLLKNASNRGKGYSVRNGLLQATGDIVMFTDADLSAPMEEASRLFAAIEAGADVAIGSRWLERQAHSGDECEHALFADLRCNGRGTRSTQKVWNALDGDHSGCGVGI
jgi:glycosyltransferase involved in cell wall biosynthesis